MTTYQVGDEQILLLMLKLEDSRFRQVSACLDRLFFSSPAPQAAVRCSKVLNVIGKYDLALPLVGNSLSVLSRAAYNLLSFLEQRFPGSVVDFLKIPAFRWDGFATTPSPPNSVALVQIKLKRPLRTFSQKRTVLKAVADLGDRFKLDLWGGLSWHEIIVDLAGPSFHTAHDFFMALFEDSYTRKNVSEYSSIPVWNSRARYESFDFRLQRLLKATDYEKSLQNLDSEDTMEARLGFIDLACTSEVRSIEALEQTLQSYEKSMALVGRRKYSSVLLFPPHVIRRDKPPSATEEAAAAEEPPFLDDRQAETLRRGLGQKLDHIVKEKLEALRLQLGILRNDSRFRYLIPSSLLASLESLEVDGGAYPEGDIQGYIVTLQHVFQQRLAGTYPASSTGIITGYADGFGGFQRILLAAESLLGRAMRIMLPKMLKSQQVLVLFDHTGLHETDLSIYEEVRRLSRQAPIIVRLTCLKYEPWSWHRGIRDIALWCREIERMIKRDLLQVFHRHQPPNSTASYVCKVLRKKLFKELFVFEAERPLAERMTDGTYCLDRARLASFAAEMDSVDDLKDQDWYDPRREKDLCEQLRAGVVLVDELKEDRAFCHYVNAYFSLPFAERCRPRTATSFVLSLYSGYRLSLGD